MSDIKHPPIAIVGVGAVLPDAPNAVQFWENIKNGRYSITEVPHDRWDPDLFFDSDHVNAAGAVVVSRLVAERMLELGLAP